MRMTLDELKSAWQDTDFDRTWLAANPPIAKDLHLSYRQLGDFNGFACLSEAGEHIIKEIVTKIKASLTSDVVSPGYTNEVGDFVHGEPVECIKSKDGLLLQVFEGRCHSPTHPYPVPCVFIILVLCHGSRRTINQYP